MTRRFANRGCRQPGSRQCEHLGFRQGPASRPGYPGWVTALVRVCSDDDFTAWVDITNTVVPNERTTVAKIRAAEEPGRLLLLAESRGVPVGCGIAAPSSLAGRAFIAVRVLPDHRRNGVGSVLAAALIDHARALGLTGVNSFVYADEPYSIAFVRWLGLAEVDYQLEQIRVISDEPAPQVPAGIELVALASRREELLEAVWPLAQQGYADMPLPGEAVFTLGEWLREEATCPQGSFIALEGGERVGYAGLLVHADGPAVAEHGLTVVRRDRRGRGIARMLKLAQMHYAASSHIARLITWTQQGNEAMQALNRSLGYTDSCKVITYQGPLPAVGEKS